ncbi:sulfate/molybdate ABC transporter ATP-binding protein [Nocardioides pocheonensis]|uniref:ATP-binding cassette domain-containing protein n=1 Tax=Nocardioides pocheonensis TaxID=661485 RepID=A0A3N0GLV6_9ACTN|nr:ATP-binding cassette domain-containing protein [Nocardioides pocheonensis]RNM13050.1 ATP-binding cassette domain-containing protein [Nocardioides pocheonensis]
MTTLEYYATVGARDVSVRLTVGPGETVALLGPNGAGKSTVLGVIAGLLAPTAGQVTLGGRTLVSATGPVVAPHRRDVALLAQDPLLFPHLTALENVAFGPRARGVRRPQARATARLWLDRVGVADLGDRRPHQLSGGQAQRVAVARALAADPALLLLDEPMAALDVAVAPSVRQLLREVLVDRSVLLVTHEPLDALLLADRVVVVDGGRVVEDGPTTEVLTRPRSVFAARIAGLNLVAGTWDGSGVAAAPLVVRGMTGDPAPARAEEAVAVFAPNAVSVFRDTPTGSPRNAFSAVVTDLEPLGDRVRVRTEASGHRLAADVTPAAVADLGLGPGATVQLMVKATEVTIYAASRPTAFSAR